MPDTPPAGSLNLSAGRLKAFVGDLVRATGVPRADAALVGRSLVEAELSGRSSHGLSRLGLYVRRLRAGLIAARPRMRVVASTPAACLLDADNALGPVAATRGMLLALERAREYGIGFCGVRHGNHLGALELYVRDAAESGFIALAMTNTPPAMAPPGGRTAVLGTNPIAAGLPAATGPVVIDLATSQVARGRILQLERSGGEIPPGWALDREGRPTTDVQSALQGTLAPAGGAKGFGLALLVEALAAVLTGSGVGAEVSGTFQDSSRPSDVGHCFLAIDSRALLPAFEERMTALAAAVRSVTPVDPAVPVRLPGDRGRAERARGLDAVIEVPGRLVAELNALAGELGAPQLA